MSKQPPVPSGYITLAQAATCLRLCHDTVRAWIRKGKLPAIKEGRYYFIPVEPIVGLAGGMLEIPIPTADETEAEDADFLAALVARQAEFRPTYWPTSRAGACPRCGQRAFKSWCVCGWSDYD